MTEICQSHSCVMTGGLNLSPTTRFLLLLEGCGVVNVGRLLSQEDGSVVYNRCWASPAQSFSAPRRAELMTIFYSLIFETHLTWRARSPYLYPPGTVWPIYIPRHWVHFSSLPTTRRATMEVFEPASRGVLSFVSFGTYRIENNSSFVVCESVSTTLVYLAVT
jgi:hypothetical protein